MPLTGWPGLANAALKFFNGLTIEKLLLIAVLAGYGYTMYTKDKGQGDREAYQLRSHEDAREKDRQHCDSREDRARVWMAAENDKNRAMLKDIVKVREP